MGAGPTEISTVQATVDIDPGTIPVGDRLLVRLLRGVTKATPSGSGNTWMIGAEPAAVQLLPATATFAVGNPIVRPRLSPCSTMPCNSYGRPRSEVAVETSAWASA